MNSAARIFNSQLTDFSQLGSPENCIIFHGSSIDDRGESALAIDNFGSATRVEVSYDHERMRIKIGGDWANADECTDLFSSYITGKSVILEATTLGFSEIFCCIRLLVELQIDRFQIIYAEPAEYTQENPGTDSFELSDEIVGYHPIPKAIVDLSSDAVEAGVFFLGFEPTRLERALEEFQMISSKEVKVIFGVPAFHPGWELHSLVPHLSSLSERQGFEVAYCAANDPSAAYECLEKTRKSLSDGNRMFVAPIGTKPCGIAAALFASLNPEQVGLLYDHPQKRKKRSKGIGTLHRYLIALPKLGRV